MVRSETVVQPSGAGAVVAGSPADALRAAVSRTRRELAAHPAELPDRAAAEEELALMEVMAAHGTPEVGRLRGSLLLVAAALGSVSALADALGELRRTTEAFGRGGAGASGG